MKKTILWIICIIVGLIVIYNINAASEPPVSILFRSSMVGLGKVMVITNTSDKPLYEVAVKANNHKLHEEVNRVVAVTLEPSRSIDVGWMEINWMFQPGENFRISARGYPGSFIGTVPK
jgi:hypothetical protein